MRVATLGSLALDGRPVRGERLAATVRELVHARGRSVSTSALVDVVWDVPPDDAKGAVQALVSRVRRLGLPVEAVPGGYRLPPDDVQIDAVEARGLVELARAQLRSGEPEAARRASDAARALFPDAPELGSGGSMSLFADVVEVRAQAGLAGGGLPDEADLRRLATATPPHEPSAALLVRVLAAQGREAEALEVVERLRAELSERYGVDPAPVVARAHLALLRGELSDASPPPPRRAPLSALPPAWRRPRTPLVGRDGDVAAVTDALADSPLVSVVATGGAGKTRLATEVARRVADTGRLVRVVELAGLRTPDDVLPAVLAALGAPDTTAAMPDLGHERRALTVTERLRAGAQDLDGLLVLDNCEHLLAAAAATVASLLAAGPDVVVLVTSRAPLGLAREVVHRLRTLSDGDALGLLEAAARRSGASLHWDADLARDLCHRLDDLPLALELAAARLRHMPVGDVLAGLGDRFTLLDDALRGLPERHASLWAMVDWSHELLAPQDRSLLQRLSVLPTSFTAEAAVATGGAPDVRRGLATLVEQSLLVLEEGEGGRPRYRLLEIIREYGEARLDAAGARAAAMAGLVGWARRQAVARAADFVGSGQLDAFARCGEEQDNLVAALRWAVSREEEAAVADLAAALCLLWTVRGLRQEVTDWGRAIMHADDPRARSRWAPVPAGAPGREPPDAETGSPGPVC